MAATDTIVALSSGSTPSGVAVVRLSGDKSLILLEKLIGPLPAARSLALRSVRSANGSVLDQGLVAQFPSPNSFTGEDCAELHLHGSSAVVKAVLSELTTQKDVRLAEPGEFTRRAFENGRLDLVEVDGLGDLIAAETESQRTQALSRMSGGLTEQVEAWRDEIIFAMAEIEAQLDFSDEGDVSDLSLEVMRSRLSELAQSLRDALASYEGGRIVRDGFRIGLGGLPNAGKSSLLNRLARSEVAIVTDEAGTTRDLREVSINLDGQLVILIDSAGIRDTESKAEAEGVRRAIGMLEEADLALWLVAPDVKGDQSCPVDGTNIVTVFSKSDLGTVGEGLGFSAGTGAGMEELLDMIRERLGERVSGGGDVVLSHIRDRDAIKAALREVERAADALDSLELAAESLRRGVVALERLVGRVDAEQVLDRLFAGFCIGK